MAVVGFTMGVTVDEPFETAVTAVRAGLVDAGFGVVTEVDLRATFAAKLGVDVPAQVILGACRPDLAYRALQADPRVAALLPCNVVVADANGGRTRVEVFDPNALAPLADSPALAAVAAEAREGLARMLTALGDSEDGR